MGLIIQRDRFPDRLFAPAKRNTLLADGANPVFDKEMRSEIFAQGTLMLRLVIQVSMLLAIPLMAVCLYWKPQLTPWYMSYTLIFNMLVGPVFSAGSVTSERERETLELLLDHDHLAVADPVGQADLGSARVERADVVFALAAVVGVHHGAVFLEQPACRSWPIVAIVAMTCLTTACLALFSSVFFKKTATSLMTTYLVIVLLFCAPLAMEFFASDVLSHRRL